MFGLVVARRVLVVLLAVTIASTMPAASNESKADSADRVLVEHVARDYLEGWYTADPERMGRALHADMVKRYVEAMPGGRQVVHTITRDLMIEMTRTGGGSRVPAGARNINVQALEVSGDIAVVRASSSEYVEYLSLAKCNGQWVILNILWRFQSPDKPRSQQ